MASSPISNTSVTAISSRLGRSAQQLHLLHFVTDDLVREGIVDRLAAAKAAGRASGALEFFLRRYGLERDATVGTTNQTLRPSPELSRVPAALVRVAENHGNDFNCVVHDRAH